MTKRSCLFVLCAFISILMITSAIGAKSNSAPGLEGRTQSPNQKKVDKEKLKEEIREKADALQGTSGCPPAQFPYDFRTIDGTNNNCFYPTWGSAPIELLRLTTIGYADGKMTPSGENRPNVRTISNKVAHQGDKDFSYDKKRKFSDYLWQWGQFLDHDLDLTPVVAQGETFPIKVPLGDIFFDPGHTGTQMVPLDRSVSTTDANGVRQQVNHITAFIDASNVYGSDSERALALRMLDGTGRLKTMTTSVGELLPFNKKNENGDVLPNAAPAGMDPETFFLAGDFRANEQVGLTAMHTLFVREHNYWADHFRDEDPTLTGDEVYEWARAIVAAEMQHITYNEFLPLLLGKIAPYRGYQPDVNPGISNVFATAAYRFGHSLVASTYRRLNEEGQSMGDQPIQQAFFNPTEITTHGIDPLLRGLASQAAQRFDVYIVDGLRNHLFESPVMGGADLASFNMQRGRDHGLPDYNQIRKDFGLHPVKNFNQINPDRIIQNRLQAAYGSVEDLDMWMAGLAEKPVSGAVVGETVLVVLKDQFERLRDGDRFWFEIYLPRDLVKMVKKQTLAKIIGRNTNIGSGIQKNAFLVP